MLKRIYDWCIDAAHKPYALWILSVVSFAESSFFPVPPDVMLIPMALALEAGSESYAPLARAIIGGLLVSVTLTVFIVPSAVYLVYRKRHGSGSSPSGRPATSH